MVYRVEFTSPAQAVSFTKSFRNRYLIGFYQVKHREIVEGETPLTVGFRALGSDFSDSRMTHPGLERIPVLGVHCSG